MREHESISSLKLFNGCPRCYWLKYVAGLEQKPSLAQLQGRTVHKAISEYHEGIVWEDIKSRLELTGECLNGISDDEIELANYQVEKLVETYIKNVPQGACDKTERHFMIPMVNLSTGEELPVKFEGYIDGENSKIDWLFEHKTSSSYWKTERANTSIQATGYAYAYYVLTGNMPEGIRFNILKKNKVTMKYQPLETYRTFEDLLYFFNWFKNTIEEIQVSDFEPRQTRFNFHHESCPYAN